MFTEEERRAQVVSIAASQVGLQNPDNYWKVVCPPLCGNAHTISWCGGFALACLHQAGLTDKMWTIGHGFLLTPPAFGTTKDPKPGDIAYFNQPFQHHAIVAEIVDGKLITIDGNQGAPEERVARRERVLATCGATFYSIAPLVEAAVARDVAETAAATSAAPPSA